VFPLLASLYQQGKQDSMAVASRPSCRWRALYQRMPQLYSGIHTRSGCAGRSVTH